MWSKGANSRLTLWVVLALVIVILGGIGTWLVLEFWLPYRNAKNTMPQDGIMELYEQPDGSLRLDWPQGENADGYVLDIMRPGTQELLYSYTTDERTCMLPHLPQEELTIRISSFAGYREDRRPGEHALCVTTSLTAPKISNLSCTVDPDADQVDIQFDLASKEICRLYILDGGEPVQLQTLTDGHSVLMFGAYEDYPVPPHGQDHMITFDAYREIPGLTFYGSTCQMLQLTREDFLGTVLHLEYEDLGNNAYTFSWNETKGESYEVQQLADGQWQTLEVLEQDAQLVYKTGHLPKFKEFSFRVKAVGGQAEDGKPIESETVSVTTGAAAVYSTVWPIQELEVYAATDRKEVIGKAPAAAAYCVVEEKDGLFGIRFGDTTGYIDSSFCMINLTEYIEDLCAYEIANSHHAIYMVHDYEIPKVTDTVIAGYENVMLVEKKSTVKDEQCPSCGNGQVSYLVPFLYPSAQKLVKAAFAAQDLGYQLKIYDSYRPQKATNSIYELTQVILGDILPEFTFPEKKEMIKNKTWVEPTEATEPSEPAPEDGTTAETTEPAETKPKQTYQMLMTDNGRYALANFLAKGFSNHNLGVALDLTLVDIRTGEELKMQSAIHDLSWYSELKLNNAKAKELQKIMVGAGFATLKSEWWHFQDDDAKTELKLKALRLGVSAECWMRDDAGWRYRRADGTFYTNCRCIIDGVTYHFDENGYTVT